MTSEEWRAIPMGVVRIEHAFPDGQRNESITVLVDDKPVARLPVTKVGFDLAYQDGYGHVTLTMTAGDTLILSSRPKRRDGADDR